jgi:hypothetical protein
MNKKSKSTLKYKILSLIVSFSLTVLLGYAIYLGIKEHNALLITLSSLFFLIILFSFVLNLYEVQWIVFSEDCISSFNVFGLIKKIPYKNIKKSIFLNLSFERIKNLNIMYKECVVICELKSTPRSSINNAYNNKKKRFIVFECTNENLENFYKYYKEATGTLPEIN